MPASLLNKPALTIDSGGNFFIRNNTDRQLTQPDGRTPFLRYARLDYPLSPGERVIVPFSVVALYFGDPRSRNGMIQKFKDSQGEGVIPTREAELGRIAVYYGVYEDGIVNLPNVVPDISIFTLDEVEIVPPCFDPYGDNIYGFQKNMDQTQGGVAATMESLQAQMDQLRSMQESMLARGQDNDADVEEDLPGTP